MNVVIKLNSTEHLLVLEELLLFKVPPHDRQAKTVRLPFFNFISLLVTIFTEYTHQTQLNSLNLFILHYFVLS